MNASLFLRVVVVACGLGLRPASLPAQTSLVERSQKLLESLRKARKAASPRVKAAASQASIAGLGGLRLGDRVPAGRIAEAKDDQLVYQFTPADALPGLHVYEVGVLPQSNRIARITALTVSAAPGVAAQVLDRLKVQFGASPTHEPDGDGGTWTWSQGARTVQLLVSDNFVTVEASDEGLLAEGVGEMRQWRARPATPAVLGGPACLSSATMESLFGVSLGQVLPPRRDALTDDDGLLFDLKAPMPMPPFKGRVGVVVSTRSNRVLKVFNSAAGMTEAQKQALVADLQARFGPSTMWEPLDKATDASKAIRWVCAYPAGQNRRLELIAQGNGDTLLALTDEALTAQLRAEASVAQNAAPAARTPALATPEPRASSPAPEAPADAQARERRDLAGFLGRLPELSPELRRNFAATAERASRLGCVIAVPFAPGASTLAAGEEALLAEAVRTGIVRQILDNPKAMFLIIGYAEREAAGRAQALSTERSQAVLRVFRERGGITNLMYGFGAGTVERISRQGTTSVEVWAVVP